MNSEETQEQDVQDKTQALFMGLFPESSAPTFYEKPSELVLKKELDWKIRDSRWGARGDEWRGLSVVDEETREEQRGELDESAVFHARLQHQSYEERKWDLGIGKGGHLYSIYSFFGEAVPPQNQGAQWMDEAWQFTTIFPGIARMNELREAGQDDVCCHCGNAFVHQSGMYIKGEMEKKTFYTPMLGEYFDPEKRSFSMLNWGQIPTPSMNRSGVLIYVNYRDLGDGVIEMSYLVYNSEDACQMNLGPWGGVRHSLFREQVVANPDGSYRYWHPVSFFSDDRSIPFNETGGWIAATPNADNPYDYALGVVFGKDMTDGAEGHTPSYACGYADDAMRDYMVQATNYGPEEAPRTPHLIRMYFVIGSLEHVAKKGNILAEHADYQVLDFNEDNVPLVPLYAKTLGEDTVLSREGAGDAQCQIYAWPVKGSYPLFVIKNNKTGRHFVTLDPYTQCSREPFANPFEPDHELHAKYENQTVYHTYTGQTEWVELLGFVMPKDEADASTYDTVPLAEIPAIANAFDAGEKMGADEVVVCRK
jgi:hypothetical protein